MQFNVTINVPTDLEAKAREVLADAVETAALGALANGFKLVFSTPERLGLDRDMDGSDKPSWEVVSGDDKSESLTERMGVAGGYLYRTLAYDKHTGSLSGVALAYVPNQSNIRVGGLTR